MIVNFQIIYSEGDISNILNSAIIDAYSNQYLEVTEEEIEYSYIIKYEYALRNHNYIVGIEIDIENILQEELSTDLFLESLFDYLLDERNIITLIKFHDETRFETYIDYYKEIAEIEMRLREILSCIFYYEYSEEIDNLLFEYRVRFPKNMPDNDLLRKRLENEFFYLTFSNYLNLDKPKKVNNAKDISLILESSSSFEVFKDNLCNRGIKNEKHLEFLAAINQDLTTIEGVRNAVAHNRTISSRKLGHYNTAKQHLINIFNKFWDEEDFDYSVT